MSGIELHDGKCRIKHFGIFTSNEDIKSGYLGFCYFAFDHSLILQNIFLQLPQLSAIWNCWNAPLILLRGCNVGQNSLKPQMDAMPPVITTPTMCLLCLLMQIYYITTEVLWVFCTRLRLSACLHYVSPLALHLIVGKEFQVQLPMGVWTCKQIHSSYLHKLTLLFSHGLPTRPPPLHSRNVECTWTGSCMRKNDCCKSPAHLFRDRSLPGRSEKNYYPFTSLIPLSCGATSVKAALLQQWMSAACLPRMWRDWGYTEK